ncbi:hypothetical protein AKJ16_DCAP12333 [Drosera capensis]
METTPICANVSSEREGQRPWRAPPNSAISWSRCLITETLTSTRSGRGSKRLDHNWRPLGFFSTTLGTVTVSTPFSIAAFTSSSLAFSGSLNLRRNFPLLLSTWKISPKDMSFWGFFPVDFGIHELCRLTS